MYIKNLISNPMVKITANRLRTVFFCKRNSDGAGGTGSSCAYKEYRVALVQVDTSALLAPS